MDETEEFQCLGHSNWTICSLSSQYCFPNFTIFSLLYWGCQFLLPQEANTDARTRLHLSRKKYGRTALQHGCTAVAEVPHIQFDVLFENVVYLLQNVKSIGVSEPLVALFLPPIRPRARKTSKIDCSVSRGRKSLIRTAITFYRSQIGTHGFSGCGIQSGPYGAC